MQKSKVRFRRPTADEQTVLLGMTVKLLLRPQDIQKCDQILIDHHYLHSAQLVGEQLRYAVTWKGQWLCGCYLERCGPSPQGARSVYWLD